jgi:hypothetical protein
MDADCTTHVDGLRRVSRALVAVIALSAARALPAAAVAERNVYVVNDNNNTVTAFDIGVGVR